MSSNILLLLDRDGENRKINYYCNQNNFFILPALGYDCERVTIEAALSPLEEAVTGDGIIIRINSKRTKTKMR